VEEGEDYPRHYFDGSPYWVAKSNLRQGYFLSHALVEQKCTSPYCFFLSEDIFRNNIPPLLFLESSKVPARYTFSLLAGIILIDPPH